MIVCHRDLDKVIFAEIRVFFSYGTPILVPAAYRHLKFNPQHCRNGWTEGSTWQNFVHITGFQVKWWKDNFIRHITVTEGWRIYWDCTVSSCFRVGGHNRTIRTSVFQINVYVALYQHDWYFLRFGWWMDQSWLLFHLLTCSVTSYYRWACGTDTITHSILHARMRKSVSPTNTMQRISTSLAQCGILWWKRSSDLAFSEA